MKPLTYIPQLIVLLMAIIILSCNKTAEVNHSPEAVFVITPEIGDTSMIITFNATSSTDQEDKLSQLMFCWDFLCDYQYTDFSSAAVVQYQYQIPGTYIVKLQVMDSEGWVSVASKELIISDTLLLPK